MDYRTIISFQNYRSKFTIVSQLEKHFVTLQGLITSSIFTFYGVTSTFPGRVFNSGRQTG